MVVALWLTYEEFCIDLMQLKNITRSGGIMILTASAIFGTILIEVTWRESRTVSFLF